MANRTARRRRRAQNTAEVRALKQILGVTSAPVVVAAGAAPRKSKTARRRRRIRQRNGVRQAGLNASLVAPTTAQVERVLRGEVNRGKPFGSEWAHCRMSPLTSLGQTPKPDGLNASRFIVVDHLTSDDITCVTTNGFMIQTLPGLLPFSAVITGLGAVAATDLKVNGYTLGSAGLSPGLASQGLTGLAPVALIKEWAANYPALQAWASGFLGPTAKDDPYLATSCRVISVQRRLYYTGTLTNNSGFITVVPGNFKVSSVPFYPNVNAAPLVNQLAVGTQNGLTQAMGTLASVNTPCAIIDVQLNQTPVFNKDAVTCRVEQGVNIISKQNGAMHQMVQIGDVGSLLVPNATGIPSSGIGITLSTLNSDPTPGVNGAGAWVIDNTWQGEAIYVTGVQSNATFRLETAVCVEYELSSTAPNAPMARKPPLPQRQLVDQVHQTVNSLPVATPGFSVAPTTFS